MAIDLTCERAIPLSDVPAYVPKRRGKKVHYCTVYRWATKGVRGRVLETAFIGGLRYTTVEAVRRFLMAKPTAQHRRSDDVADAIDAALSDSGV